MNVIPFKKRQPAKKEPEKTNNKEESTKKKKNPHKGIKWTITVTPWEKDDGEMLANDYSISFDPDYDEIFISANSFDNIESLKKDALVFYNQKKEENET